MKKNDKLTAFAQELRKNATKEERLLWNCYLRNHPVQFRRQCVFDPYIVDFYCAKALLVIELDGSQHYDPAETEKDTQRTRFLESLGLKVLRFSNADVNQNLAGSAKPLIWRFRIGFPVRPLPLGLGAEPIPI